MKNHEIKQTKNQKKVTSRNRKTKKTDTQKLKKEKPKNEEQKAIR